MQEEMAKGLRLLSEIFGKSGLQISVSKRPWADCSATYLALGNGERSTDIVLTDEFLSDLPGTHEHRSAAESYAQAVAGRIRHGSADAFYCRSGVPIELHISWPIHTSATMDRGLVSWLIITATNKLDETEAICSLQMNVYEFPRLSPFQQAEQIVNRIRQAVDDGTVKFVPPGTHSSMGQIIEQTRGAQGPQTSDTEIQRFLQEKAYYLGFRAASRPRPVWVPDPWDAIYLGTTTRALSQAAHILQAKRLLTISDDYASPSDKLLSDGPSELLGGSRQRQKLSLSTLPNKANFESHITEELKKGTELALIFIDLDHFKSVNDTQGHQAGDTCLEKAIQTMGAAIGSKGTLYRWGGDEFAVCLPDFSTEEAKATAERIRQSIENSKAGGAIAVTASVGVCATDQVATTLPQDFIKNADEAMYSSKKGGRNRVTVAYKTGLRTIAQRRAL